MASNKKKIVLPNTLARAGWDMLAARADVEAIPYALDLPAAGFLALLPDADGIALSMTPFGSRELAAAPRMQVVARIGVGYDAVDVPALSARRIPLMIAGTANSPTVAEHALFLMLTLAKRGAAQDALVREGRWSDRWAAIPVDLMEKTVLIVGFGRIGTRVAKRCLGLEMRVEVYDPYVAADAVRATGCEPVGDLDAALSRADFVTLHCPKTQETANLIDAARLARMKPSAYLVNTARGGIIDETALHDALKAGRLAGAGLDVFEREPAKGDHPLFRLPGVVLAAHVAGVSRESLDRMAVTTVRNILGVLDGKPNRENAVNPEVFGQSV